MVLHDPFATIPLERTSFDRVLPQCYHLFGQIGGVRPTKCKTIFRIVHEFWSCSLVAHDDARAAGECLQSSNTLKLSRTRVDIGNGTTKQPTFLIIGYIANKCHVVRDAKLLGKRLEPGSFTTTPGDNQYGPNPKAGQDVASV